MKAFVLAGGFATRLWPLTEKRAKPLLPLAGVPLLTHLVEKIPRGIPVTVSTNQVFAEEFEKWRAMLRDGPPRHAEEHRSGATMRLEARGGPPQHDANILIEDAGNEDEKLGALGALAKWITEERIDDDVLLLAGDNYVGFSVEAFIKRFTGKPLLAACDIRDREKAKKFGIVMTENEPLPTAGTYRVTGFQEKPESPQSTLVSTGCYVLPVDSLNELVTYAKQKPDNIGGVFEHFLAVGMEVHCASFAGPWFDIGSFEAYLEATSALVSEHVLFGEGALQRECTFSGSVVFGRNSKAARSTLTDVVLFEDCEIEDCVLEHCVIDNGCVLRGVELSGKMLREGTELTR
jgi:glucose-1-phosphate thymidylyltransferase